MFRVQPISSFADDPLLAPYATMKLLRAHRQERIFVAEGHQVVKRLLRSPNAVHSVVLPEHWLPRMEPLIAARPEVNLPVFIADKNALQQLTGYEFYQGVLAVGAIPEPQSVETLIAGPNRPRLFLALDGLANADNMGMLVRTAAAFGVDGLITSSTSCSPWLRRAVRTSMGAILQVPLVEQVNLPSALLQLKEQGIQIVAAHPREGATSLHLADLRGDSCIVLGSEGEGLTESVVRIADQVITIPMSEGFDSLNVQAAGAIFLHEAMRQQSEAKGERGAPGH